jgi:hypothetical protein
VALRRFGLRAVHVQECALPAHQDERALAQPMEDSMSAFSDRIRSNKTGFFRVADLEGGKELTLTISHLDEELEIFGKTVDVLNFTETGQQLQLNQTNAEFLLDSFGDNPGTYSGKRVTLFLGEYEYNKQKKKGIRPKLPGTADAATQVSARSPNPKADRKPDRKADLKDEIPF